MKRSGFLKSLSAVIFAPSILSHIDTEAKQVEEPKAIIPPVKHLGERLRVGDLVIFSNGQKAYVTSMTLGAATFRSITKETLTDTSNYTKMFNSFQEK